MEEDRKLIDTVGAQYFNSVKELFEFSKQNAYKPLLSFFLLTIPLTFFFINIIPVFVLYKELDLFFFFFDFLKNYFGIYLYKNDFLSNWIVGILFSGLTVLPFYMYYIYWDKQKNKKFLHFRTLNFCYLYSIRLEIISFLANERPEHLKKAIRFFEKRFKINPILKILPVPYGRILSIESLYKYSRENDWFELTEKTSKILQGLIDLEDKIIKRLFQRVEIELIQPAIDYLILREFSFIKPNAENFNGQKLGELKLMYFELFADEINKLSAIDTISEGKGKSIIKSIIVVSSNLLLNNNIIILFISWTILLAIIFFLIAQIMITVLDTKSDSTIIAALLTAVFLGSITIAVAIYAKKGKK